MRKNTTGQYVAFQAISKTDGSDVITGTPVVYYTIDGGTQAQTTATAVHEGNGQWSVALSQAETNGDHIVFSFVLTGAVTQTVNVYTIDADLTNLDVAVSTRSTVAATDIVSGGAITTSGGAVSNVTLVATTTTNSDMRGTDGANTVAPNNASIAAILTDTGTTIPASISALNDLSQADVRTAVGLASANLDTQLGDIPTVSEFNARTLVASAYFDPTTDTVTTDAASRTASQADVSALATAASIAALNDLSSTDVTNAVWDASTSSHNVAGSFGRGFRQVKEGLVSIDGQVNDLSATTTSFISNLASAVDDFYNDQTIHFISGSLTGQSRVVVDYNGTTKAITVDQALTSAPANGDEFIILSNHVHSVAEIVDAVWSEDQSTYTTAGSFGYYLDSQVSAAGGGTPPTAAQIADAVWDEVRSPDHVTEGTFGYYVDAQVSSAGAGGSGLYQVTVTVQNESAEVLQGARVNVDGTTLTLVTDSSGQCVFILDSGIYTLHVSPPAGYQTPTGNVVTITSSDVSSTFTLEGTTPSGDCDVPWVG